MNKKNNKTIIYILIITFFFLFKVNTVYAAMANFEPGVSVGGKLTQSGKFGENFSLDCAGVHFNFNILGVEDNNEQKSDCAGKAGVFYDATNVNRIKKLTKDMSEQDGKDHYILWGRSISWGTTNRITLSINNSTTNQSCEGTITVNPYKNSNKYIQENSSFKFEWIVTSDKTEEKQSFKTKVYVDVVKYSNDNGENLGHYEMELDGETEQIAKDMTNYSKSGSEEDKKKAQQTSRDLTKQSGSSVNYKVPTKTTMSGVDVGTSQKLECEQSLADLIRKYWKYVMLFTPILLMVMIMLDFFKALFSSDPDLMKKASDAAVKRVLAAILLLCLPLVVQTILGFFGLELCI